MGLYFSDYFEVDKKILEKYGAYDISLINDLPLFIDPFLLFNSNKKQYRDLHDNMLDYLRFLKNKSVGKKVNDALIKSWYTFPEVKQNWLGFCLNGNQGRGLGLDFAYALHDSLNKIFSNFGSEKVTKGSHIEKLCLIKENVGRDNISDFTTNLIFEYLLIYTEKFSKKYLSNKYIKEFAIRHVRFNYRTETWQTRNFYLPCYKDDFVILTPKDMLTKDDNWINKGDLVQNFESIPSCIENDELRAQVNNYFTLALARDENEKKRSITKKEKSYIVFSLARQYPEIIDYYIKFKELNGNEASIVSQEKVKESAQLYVYQLGLLTEKLSKIGFYNTEGDSYSAALKRINYLKDVIENMDGYRLFYVKGQPIKKEEDLQIAYRLTWYDTSYDVNREVNNGRGSVDFKVSKGRKDKTLIEFKLASNPQLKRNLQNQVAIYEKANSTKKSIKVILYFTEKDWIRVTTILKELKLNNSNDIILIDARSDNKPSASTA